MPESNEKTITSVKASYLEKKSATEYEKKYFEDIVEQIFAEGAIAGQPAGATLTAILNALKAKIDEVNGKAGVTSVKVGNGTAETGAVAVTTTKLGIDGKLDLVDTLNNNLNNNTYQFAKKSDLTSVLKFKGTVDDKTKLPAENNTIGDVYHVKADHSEYMWTTVDGATDPSWENMGLVYDLSGYATKGELDGVKKSAETANETANTADGKADTNTSEITKLKDGTTPVGKANQLATARTIALDGDASGSANFDGTANTTINVTLKNTGVAAGIYSAVQVDAKGRVLKGSQTIVFAPSLDDASLDGLAIGGIAVVDTQA